MKTLIALALSLAVATPSLSDTGLVPLPAPEARPYPYRILELQPGDGLDRVLDRFAERSETAPTGETVIQRVQSPDGGSYEFSFETHKSIGDIGLHGRMSGAPQDMTTAWLTSDVLGQRPVALGRVIEQPSAELPALLELKKQIEDLYGPASKTEIDSSAMTLTYAWGTGGFIADLDGQPAMPVTVHGGIAEKTLENYQPCLFRPEIDDQVKYRFESPRRKPLQPGCLARYTVHFEGTPGKTRISFHLVDFDLARHHQEELDRQILQKLDGGVVAASDLDL